jgi:hypothetical protein
MSATSAITSTHGGRHAGDHLEGCRHHDEAFVRQRRAQRRVGEGDAVGFGGRTYSRALAREGQCLVADQVGLQRIELDAIAEHGIEQRPVGEREFLALRVDRRVLDGERSELVVLVERQPAHLRGEAEGGA